MHRSYDFAEAAIETNDRIEELVNIGITSLFVQCGNTIDKNGNMKIRHASIKTFDVFQYIIQAFHRFCEYQDYAPTQYVFQELKQEMEEKVLRSNIMMDDIAEAMVNVVIRDYYRTHFL